MPTLENCIVIAARRELGRGEITNNDGPDVWRYREWIDDDGAWCAAYSYYLIVQACQMMEMPMPRPLRRTHGALALGKLIGMAGQILKEPEPGCFMVWHRDGLGSGRGHIGPCEIYERETRTLQTIEGNRGKPPSKVSTFVYRAGAWEKDLAMIVTTRKP